MAIFIYASVVIWYFLIINQHINADGYAVTNWLIANDCCVSGKYDTLFDVIIRIYGWIGGADWRGTYVLCSNEIQIMCIDFNGKAVLAVGI